MRYPIPLAVKECCRFFQELVVDILLGGFWSEVRAVSMDLVDIESEMTLLNQAGDLP